MDASTTYPGPRYPPIVLAFAGDSTITSLVPACADLLATVTPVPCWTRLSPPVADGTGRLQLSRSTTSADTRPIEARGLRCRAHQLGQPTQSFRRRDPPSGAAAS